MPLTGYLAARFGTRQLLLFDIAAFIVTSALCGLAQNLDQIVLFRVLQGVAGATLTPLSQSILIEIFPRAERGKALAIYSIVAMLAPVLGPTLGGYITETLSWRWVFYINVPVGLVALLLSLRVLPKSIPRPVTTDWIGLTLLVLGVGALQLTLDLGQTRGWFASTFIDCTIAVAIIAGIAFVLRSWNYAGAIVDLTLFRDRNFTAACLLMLAMGLGFFGTIVLLPLMIQEIMGYSPGQTGLLLAPRALAGILVMPMVGGVLVGRVDLRLLIVAGTLFSAYGSYVMSHYSIEMGAFAILLPGVIQGIGMSFLYVPISTLAYETLDPRYAADASGLYNLVRILGGSIGISVSASLLARQSQTHWHTLGGHLTDTSSAAGAIVESHGPIALGALHLELGRQALMLAFNDLFWLIALSFLALLPLLLVAKLQPRRGVGTAPSLATAPEAP
jgi:DHA2 family multidrug resistance protein